MTARMIIGSSGRAVYTKKTDLTFVASEKAFIPVVTYLTALQGFASLTELYQVDSTSAIPWTGDDYTILDAKATDVRLEWSPVPTMMPMVRNGFPMSVSFRRFDAAHISRENALTLGVVDHYIYSLGQGLLTTFFENQKEVLNARYPKVRDWPDIWSFARVVRNALSHGGKLDIRDRSEVKWKGLRYSSRDNGRAIINTDIWPADLFLLIKELETSL